MLENLLLRLVSPLKSLAVQTNEAVVYLRPEDIAYVTTSPPPKRGVLIVTLDGREWRRFDSIKDIKETMAADPRFFLSHKSYLINVFAIRGLRRDPSTKRQEVTFGDQVKTAAAVSSGNLKALRDLLEL
jgi:DNA-binding LytR/AlgR family response regulator